MSERRQTDVEAREDEAIALLDNAEALFGVLIRDGVLAAVRKYGQDPDGVSRRYARWHSAVLDFVNTSPPRLQNVLRYQSELIQELQRAAPQAAEAVAKRMKGRQVHPDLVTARRAVLDDMAGLSVLARTAAEHADSTMNRVTQQEGIEISDPQEESLWAREIAAAFEAGHRNRGLPLARTLEMAAIDRLAKMLRCAPTPDDVINAVENLLDPRATRDTDVNALFPAADHKE